MDAYLFSCFIASCPQTASLEHADVDDPLHEPNALQIFLSLLSGPSQHSAPTTPYRGKRSQIELDFVFNRFSNNNFTLHSRLSPIAHGVFPLPSRVFNHSCTPNAASRFIYRENETPLMEVVALKDIAANEEVSNSSPYANADVHDASDIHNLSRSRSSHHPPIYAPIHIRIRVHVRFMRSSSQTSTSLLIAEQPQRKIKADSRSLVSCELKSAHLSFHNDERKYDQNADCPACLTYSST